MKVALAQTNIIWEDKEANLFQAESLISDAAKDSTDIRFFPEMSFTGFSMNTQVTGEKNRYAVDRISNIAKQGRIAVGFGWVRWHGDICENVYTILDPSGNPVSEYVKMHPFSYSSEDDYFVGGNKVVVADYKGVPFSTFICYDLRFPEIFRAVAKEAHVIVVPACWPAKRAEHWKALLKARAIENQVYILGINCQGNIGGLYYSGDSCVITPNGDVAVSMSGECGLLTYNLVDNVDDYRNGFPVLKDMKNIIGLPYMVEDNFAQKVEKIDA